MIDGIFTQKIEPIDAVMPQAPYPLYPSGLKESDDAIYRYAHRSSKHPVLAIVDSIRDGAGVLIPAGYYELVLSDERDFFILVQSGKIFAIIPVFKVEEDKKAFEKMHDKKYQKALKKKQKAQEKIDKKRAKSGLQPDVEEEFSEANIEYQREGKYYLIKYERGKIRAWGAIKG